MKRILYYVTDHGLGHLTRTISIIREFSSDIEFIIRHSNEQFIKKSLPNSTIISGKTDQGSILLDDGVSIDWNKTKQIMKEWYAKFDQNIITEKKIIEKSKPDLIISDMTPIPLRPAKELNIPTLVISNFTWADFLETKIDIDLEFLNETYRLANLAIQLPLSMPMKTFDNKRNVNLVSRFSTDTRNEIREKLGLNNSDFMIFVNLPNYYKILIPPQKNLKIFSTGATTNIQNTKLIQPYIEGQDLNLASDLVLSKCGYGMISECLTNGTPFRFLIDETHPEQIAIRKDLNNIKHDNEITSNNSGEIKLELNDLNTDRYEPFKRDNQNVKNMIMEFFK